MNQQFALALIAYLNRSAGIVPTTAAEWEMIRAGLSELEQIASGKSVAAIAPVGKGNGRLDPAMSMDPDNPPPPPPDRDHVLR
jgi:hypothetical protein